MLHLLTSRSPKETVAKCGLKVKPTDTTVWWRDVTCPDCKAKMESLDSVEHVRHG